jgi:hypothetical protein
MLIRNSEKLGDNYPGYNPSTSRMINNGRYCNVYDRYSKLTCIIADGAGKN